MTHDVATDRRGTREELRRQRREIPAAGRIAAADQLAEHLLSLPFADNAGYVAGYWASDGEIALHAWQLKLPPTQVYCLPVICQDKLLRFAPWRPGDPLVTNQFGIPEPDVAPASLLAADQMVMVVVPLVGFDESCHRLGMGGGWYDRSFAFRQKRPAPPWLVGAAFDTQRVAPIVTQAWDVGLDAVCTPSATQLRPTVAP